MVRILFTNFRQNRERSFAFWGCGRKHSDCVKATVSRHCHAPATIFGDRGHHVVVLAAEELLEDLLDAALPGRGVIPLQALLHIIGGALDVALVDLTRTDSAKEALHHTGRSVCLRHVVGVSRFSCLGCRLGRLLILIRHGLRVL